ncbi:MAG: hypothetical protein KC636_19180, partial [Myxococcales bacterium]|nr:hypothetical protein [Myxococcales bacterium]
PGDQASLVSFGAAPQVLVRGVATPDSSLTSSLASITPAGATGLERGLYTGFEVARRTSVGFPGATRVVLITDDRPTVGQTAPGAFFSLVSAAASRGVGLTTLGVGPQFAAPLAYKLSSVRGGNVLYLRSPEHARERIAGELDTLVTELAHALVIELDPAPGMRVTDVYGVPGELLVREGDRVSLRVETIFLSKRRGAIYLALAPKGRANLPREPVRTGARLGEVRLRYRALDQALRSDRAALVNIAPRRASPGLTRGALLVDQLTSMRAASERYYGAPDVPADRRAAYEQLRALADRYRAVVDPALAAQRELVLRLEETLAASAGVRSSP